MERFSDMQVIFMKHILNITLVNLNLALELDTYIKHTNEIFLLKYFFLYINNPHQFTINIIYKLTIKNALFSVKRLV